MLARSVLWQRHGTGLARTTLDLGGDCPRRRAAASASCRRCSPATIRRSASDFRANLPTAGAAELGRARSAQPRLSVPWRCGSQAARVRQCGHGLRVSGRMSAMGKGWRLGPWDGSNRRIQSFEAHVGRRIQSARPSAPPGRPLPWPPPPPLTARTPATLTVGTSSRIAPPEPPPGPLPLLPSAPPVRRSNCGCRFTPNRCGTKHE